MISWADIVTVTCSDLVTMAGLCEFLCDFAEVTGLCSSCALCEFWCM